MRLQALLEDTFDVDRIKHLLSFARGMQSRWDKRILASDLDPKSNPSHARDVFKDALTSIDEYLACAGVTHQSELLETLKQKISEELQQRSLSETDLLDGVIGIDDFLNTEKTASQLREAKSKAYDLSRQLDPDLFIYRAVVDSREEAQKIQDVMSDPHRTLPPGASKSLLSYVEEKEIEATALLSALTQRTEPAFSEVVPSVRASMEILQIYRNAFDPSSSNHLASRAEVQRRIGDVEGTMQIKHGDSLDLIREVNLICKDEATGHFGADYKRLRALGISDAEIIHLAKNPSGDASCLAERITAIQQRFDSLKKATRSEFLVNKLELEIDEIKSLFANFDKVKDVSQSLAQWANNSVAFMRKEIATAESFLMSAYDQKKDDQGTPIKDTYHAKPDAAFLLVGQQRASNSESWPAVEERYDRMIALFESDFCKLLIADGSGADSEAFTRTKGIAEVFTTVSDDLLISRLHETHDEILREFPPVDRDLSEDEKAERNNERMMQYLVRLERINPVFEHTALEGTTQDKNGLERYLNLLRQSRRAVCYGNLVDKTCVTDPDERMLRQEQADQMLRALYTDIQGRDTRKIVHHKLEDLIAKARHDRDTRLKNISTPWTNFKHHFKSQAYKVNTALGLTLKLAHSGGTVLSVGCGIAALGFAITAGLPAALPFVALGLIFYFPKWVVNPFLSASVDLAKEGREHEQEAANLKLAAQYQRLKESTDDVDMWIAIYVTMLEDNLDRFEPTNQIRKAHLRYFMHSVLSSQGIIEPMAENRGIIREDVGLSKGFVAAISVIAGGWADVAPAQRKAAEIAIRKAGFDGKHGNAAWRAFIKSYGDPDKTKKEHLYREILPIPDEIRAVPVLDRLARSTIPFEKRQENDLSIVMRNIFGDDMLLNLSYVNALRIQPDGKSIAGTLSSVTSRVTSKMPSFGEGKDGRTAQLTRRESVSNFLGHLLAETEVRSGKKGGK
jgi:hypothetical protein